MRQNRLRGLHAEGKTIVNSWLASPSSYIAELIGHLGFDSVVVDMQHGMIGQESAVHIFQALSSTSAVPLARAAANDPAHLMFLLDAGAYGIICPGVESVADVERFVAACKYPPVGRRSFGPARGLLYGGADYFVNANEEVMTFALIETRGAVEALEEIVKIPGLDGLYVGSNDLALSLGFRPVLEPTLPEMLDWMKRIADIGRHAGKLTGAHAITEKGVEQRLSEGFSMITVGGDVTFIRSAAEECIARVRKHA